MKYKHIVFDIDGTLIDTEYAVINSLIKTITEITGCTPQYESLKFALGIYWKKCVGITQNTRHRRHVETMGEEYEIAPAHYSTFSRYQRMLAIPFIKRL